MKDFLSMGVALLLGSAALGCSSDDGAAPSNTDCSAAGACGSLSGAVTRVATTKPKQDGLGSVYVAVFDGNPVTEPEKAVNVGRALIEDADLNADDARVPYRIEALPPRETPYQVIAFFDDNGTASATAPGPDKGDLASLDLDRGFQGFSAQVTTPTEVTLDLPLNAVMP